ncbi:MAG: hypothetical protein LUH22_04425 [Bacteroides sp.]|nr:hypothetical protein [Bacteroides sp.]
MTRTSKLIGFLLLFIITSYSCVKDGEELCPEGNVRLRIYAEKFQNKSDDPLSDRESIFYDRVSHIRYYLYKDGVLDRSVIVNVFDDVTSDSYLLNLPDLEYGNYQIALVTNSTRTALTGDGTSIDNLLLTYPGSDLTEDYFSQVFSFEVNSPDTKEYNVGLSRVQGVIRYTFNNLPEDASYVEVIMKNVSNEKWITGEYMNACQANRRYAMIPVTRAETEDLVMGTFPTLTTQRSALDVNLYKMDGDVAFMTQMISDTLTVSRNQLLDIVLTYEDGKFNYEILMDTTWDGSSSGGEVDI